MEPVLDIHLAPKIGFVVWNTGADANTMDKASQPLPAMMTNSTPNQLGAGQNEVHSGGLPWLTGKSAPS